MDTRHHAVLLAVAVVFSAGAATAAPSGALSLQQEETATVSFTDQSAADGAVTVDSVTLPEGGFVAIHVVEDGAPGEIIGVTEFLPAGTTTDVQAQLDEELEAEQDLVAMAHRDTDGDEAFGFVDTDGAADGPYTDTAGDPVTDTATVTPESEAEGAGGPPDQAGPPDDGDEAETSEEETPEGEETPEEETPEEETDDEEDEETAETAGLAVTALEAPANATIGRTLSVVATVENNGENETTQRVEFRLEGGLVSDQSVTVDAGETETVTFDVRTRLYNLSEGQFRHGVLTEDDGRFASINLTQSYRVTDLTAPEEATVGDNVTVEATVENPNAEASTQGVDFRLGGPVADSTALSLDGGESETVTFVVNSSGLDAGSFTHGVFTRTDGQLADIELVQPEETANETETETPTNETATETETETPTDETETPADETETETPTNETEVDELLNETEPSTNETETNATTNETATANETAAANVSFANQATDGRTVVVESVRVPEGGFVVIHDRTLFDGNVVGSVIGVSEPLEPGLNEAVNVTLFDVSGASTESGSQAEGQTLVAMAHRDTNDNGTFDFVATNGSADGPYVDEFGEPVTDDARAIVGNGTQSG